MSKKKKKKKSSEQNNSSVNGVRISRKRRGALKHEALPSYHEHARGWLQTRSLNAGVPHHFYYSIESIVLIVRRQHAVHLVKVSAYHISQWYSVNSCTVVVQQRRRGFVPARRTWSHFPGRVLLAHNACRAACFALASNNNRCGAHRPCDRA